MIDTMQILTPILLVDILNPVLLAMLIFAASSGKPVINSASMLLGHTATYFVAGYLLSFGVEKVSAYLENPGTIDYVVSGIIGLYCVYWAAKPSKPSAEPELPDWNLTPVKCLFFGSLINAIGLPFAIPYLAAIDQILKADLATGQAFTVLGIYNLAYALPFTIVPASIAVMGDSSKTLLETLRNAMLWVTDKAMPWLILALGIWLIWDAVSYFADM